MRCRCTFCMMNESNLERLVDSTTRKILRFSLQNIGVDIWFRTCKANWSVFENHIWNIIRWPHNPQVTSIYSIQMLVRDSGIISSELLKYVTGETNNTRCFCQILCNEQGYWHACFILSPLCHVLYLSKNGKRNNLLVTTRRKVYNNFHYYPKFAFPVYTIFVLMKSTFQINSPKRQVSHKYNGRTDLPFIASLSTAGAALGHAGMHRSRSCYMFFVISLK